MTLIEILVIQAAVLAAGIALGWLARRVVVRSDGARAQVGGIGESLAFVGGTLGILLGLLLVFSVDHFSAAQQSVRDETGAAVIVFNAAETFAADERDAVQRNLTCYLRSVIADDWADQRVGKLNGDDEAHTWAARVQASVAGLSQSTTGQATTHQFAIEHQLLMDQARQSRLQLGTPEIPPLIWLVIFASSFAFVALLAFSLSANWPVRLLAAISVSLVVLVSIGTLYELDRPYEGWSGSSLQPVIVEATLQQLRDGFPNADWSPCPRGIANPNA